MRTFVLITSWLLSGVGAYATAPRCGPELVGHSSVARSLARRLARYDISDLPDGRGHLLRLRDEASGETRLPLPGLRFTGAAWRWDTWRPGGLTYYSYDAGPRHLADDARELNTLVAAEVMRAEPTSLALIADGTRARDLRWLARLREATAAWSPAPATPDAHSNVDVLAITTRPLDWDGDLADGGRTLVGGLHITYDQPLDFVRPSLDGVLAVINEAPTSPRTLPAFMRLTSAAGRALAHEFWRRLATERACELSALPEVPDDRDLVLRRLMRQAFRLVRERGCDVVVSLATPERAHRLHRFGFRLDAAVAGDAGPEYLMRLNVRSPEFLSTYERLNGLPGE